MRTVLLVPIIALVWIHFATADETFYSALESEELVEAEGGTVEGGEFAPAKFGNGYVSKITGDLISFPTEGRFTNPDAGTVEFWVKLGRDAFANMGYLFSVYDPWANALWVLYSKGKPILLIKSGGLTYSASANVVDWQAREIHHIAATWGPNGMRLYLDRGLAASSDKLKRGPETIPETFQINNIPAVGGEDAAFPTNCVVDEVRISSHQKEPGEFVMRPPGPVQPRAKATTTWGGVKGMY